MIFVILVIICLIIALLFYKYNLETFTGVVDDTTQNNPIADDTTQNNPPQKIQHKIIHQKIQHKIIRYRRRYNTK